MRRRFRRRARWQPWLVLAVMLVIVWVWRGPDRGGPRDWSLQQTRFPVCGPAVGYGDPCVWDGDTLFIGAGEQARRIRLTGYDAPELDGACAAEIARAQDARAALAQWLGRGPFEWSGGTDPPRDRYGRELREVRRVENGEMAMLADAMIAAGLASEDGWGATAVDWCA